MNYYVEHPLYKSVNGTKELAEIKTLYFATYKAAKQFTTVFGTKLGLPIKTI